MGIPAGRKSTTYPKLHWLSFLSLSFCGVSLMVNSKFYWMSLIFAQKVFRLSMCRMKTHAESFGAHNKTFPLWLHCWVMRFCTSTESEMWLSGWQVRGRNANAVPVSLVASAINTQRVIFSACSPSPVLQEQKKQGPDSLLLTGSNLQYTYPRTIS